jgi:hypothetical protein
MFGDISNIHNNVDLIYILTAVLIVDMIVILIARDTTLFGKSVNEWYNKYTMKIEYVCSTINTTNTTTVIINQ